MAASQARWQQVKAAAKAAQQGDPAVRCQQILAATMLASQGVQ
jgi:hypothetical protein